MSKRPGLFLVFLCNCAWFLSCLPGLLAFAAAIGSVRRTQERVLARILRRNRGTAFGRRQGLDSIRSSADFAKVPLSEYSDYHRDVEAIQRGESNVLFVEKPLLLQPTSGSTSGTKLIPYTASLQREFRAAIDPWIAGLYWNRPGLFFGRQYWSISPNTPCVEGGKGAVPIGFADDTEYLGAFQRRIARVLFPVPPEVRIIADAEAFRYATLLFLMRERNLRLISAWHPSFLGLLLEAMPGFSARITADIRHGTMNASLAIPNGVRAVLAGHLEPDAERARELESVDFSNPAAAVKVWPNLALVSCWTEGWAKAAAARLQDMLPGVLIQGKGLLATEGVVSFPFGRTSEQACAIRSHFFEFIEKDTGVVKYAWEVEKGKPYMMVLTTGGGLYRYRLHDIVRVTSFVNEVPCLEFVGRDNLVSDVVGEKLDAVHVGESILRVEEACSTRFKFAMLAPCVAGDSVGYVLYAQVPERAVAHCTTMASALEGELNGNYHYLHARNLGQLKPVRVFRINGGADASYQAHNVRKGMKAGDIKPAALSTDVEWETVFDGEFIV